MASFDISNRSIFSLRSFELKSLFPSPVGFPYIIKILATSLTERIKYVSFMAPFVGNGTSGVVFVIAFHKEM